jgi:structure-specific endonuclease subunit SLX1
LGELQSLTSLKRLYINRCKNFTALLSVKPSADEGLHNVECMQILKCPNLVAFPTFTSLKKFNIRGISKLESIPEGLGSHDTLESLDIMECPSLKSLPESIQCLRNLTDLQLMGCSSLKTLPEGMQNVAALKSLDICACRGIKVLPKGLQQRLHSLETLHISHCPALARRCKRGGDYWDNVKDIPNLRICSDM